MPNFNMAHNQPKPSTITINRIREILRELEHIDDFISYEYGHFHVFANETAIRFERERRSQLQLELDDLTRGINLNDVLHNDGY